MIPEFIQADKEYDLGRVLEAFLSQRKRKQVIQNGMFLYEGGMSR